MAARQKSISSGTGTSRGKSLTVSAEAYERLMAEVAQAQPRTPRHFELNEDQIAYIRAAYQRGICYDKISERGLTVWQPFPGRDWLRVHKPEWEAK
jgi:hypothetical protein